MKSNIHIWGIALVMLMPKNAPAFQFYPQDFLTGTAYFTAAEVGAYIRLLCHQWITRAPLPKSKRILRRIAGCNRIDVVMKKFRENEVGFINERLEQIQKRQDEYSQQQSENAKKRPHSDRLAVAQPEGQPNGSQTDALHPSSFNLQPSVVNEEPPSPKSGDGSPEEKKPKRGRKEQRADDDFVGKIIAVFSRLYEERKGIPYLVTTPGIDRDAAGAILRVYKERNPGSDSEKTLIDMERLFRAFLFHDYGKDGFLKKISLSKLRSKFNEYMQEAQNGREQFSDEELAEAIRASLGRN